MKQRAMFVGRFQPFHLGHEYIFRTKLDLGIPLLIAIRDMEPDEKNPLTAEESKMLIEKVLEDSDVKVIIIPDIESINWGRGVGYQLNEITPPSDICNISATQIRQEIKDGSEAWKDMVNPKIHSEIFELLK